MAFPDSLTPAVDGIRFNPYYIQGDSATSSTNAIPFNRRHVIVSAVTNGAHDYVVLPALADVPNGHKISVINSVKVDLMSGASGEKINNVDSSGSDKYVLNANLVTTIIKVSNTVGWVAFALDNLGAQVTAVVVSSPSLSPSSSSSASMSPSASLSPSSSSSASRSPSASLSPSSSSSASRSPSSSSSASMSPSGSLSPSASQSPSASRSPSASSSASMSPSASLSPSSSESRSLSPSASRSPSASASA